MMPTKSLISCTAIVLAIAFSNPVSATGTKDAKSAIKECQILENFAARTANDRFVKRIPLSDALLEVGGDRVRERVVLEAYQKGPREIGNGGRAFGEQIFRRCYTGANSTNHGRTKQELLAENKKMHREALTHWAMAIQKKLRDNWERPDDAVVGWTCTATIQMDSSAKVRMINIERCDGTPAFRESVWSAIKSSSPLPRPAISAIWQQEIRINFKPE